MNIFHRRNKKNRKRRENVPGWSHYVEPFKQHSNEVYSLWVLAGKPKSGDIFEEKQAAHAQYRHVVRRVKRHSNYHQARGLFNAAMEGDLELFKEMRKVIKHKSGDESLPDSLDGISGKSEIAETF